MSKYRNELEALVKGYQEALRRTWLENLLGSDVLRKQQEQTAQEGTQPQAQSPTPETANAPALQPAAVEGQPPEQQPQDLNKVSLNRDAVEQLVRVMEEMLNVLKSALQQPK